VIDCETTGLFPQHGDRIVSFAAIELTDNVPTGRCMNLIFNPGRRSHPAALRVHGLSDDLLKHQKPFGKYAAEIAEWMHDALIIGHNVYFDLSFLRAEFARVGLAPPPYKFLCTMEQYKDDFPRRKGSLDAACRAFGISTRARAKHHGALVDASLALSLYYELVLMRVATHTIEIVPPSNYIEPPLVTPKLRGRKKAVSDPVPPQPEAE
jgi:DNA polymerase-3 subunit epsilon